MVFEVKENVADCHIPLILSPFGFTSYTGNCGIASQGPDSIISTTYFLGPGRGAHANSEILTISTQWKSSLGSYIETQSKDKCKDIHIPEYPLGAISGYNMQVIKTCMSFCINIVIRK